MPSAAMVAVAQLRAGLQALLACDLSVLGDDELLNVLTDFDTESRRMAAADATIVAEVDRRGLAGGCGGTSTAALLATMLLLDPGRAARRVRDAQQFAPRRALTGQVVAAEFAETAQASQTVRSRSSRPGWSATRCTRSR